MNTIKEPTHASGSKTTVAPPPHAPQERAPETLPPNLRSSPPLEGPGVGRAPETLPPTVALRGGRHQDYGDDYGKYDYEAPGRPHFAPRTDDRDLAERRNIEIDPHRKPKVDEPPHAVLAGRSQQAGIDNTNRLNDKIAELKRVVAATKAGSPELTLAVAELEAEQQRQADGSVHGRRPSYTLGDDRRSEWERREDDRNSRDAYEINRVEGVPYPGPSPERIRQAEDRGQRTDIGSPTSDLGPRTSDPVAHPDTRTEAQRKADMHNPAHPDYRTAEAQRPPATAAHK